MNRKLANDLQAWEAGALSADDLIARHPSQASEVRRLTGVFMEMRYLADGPVPDPTRGWNEVRSRMAAHVHVARQPGSLLDRLSPRLQRRLAIGMTAALLVVPPVAMAAADDTLREGVTDFVLGGIDDVSSSIFGPSDQTAAGQAEGGSPVELEVGDGESMTSTTQVPRVTESGAKAPATKDDSPGGLTGPDGVSAVVSGGATQVSGPVLDGAAGTNGGSGDEGPGGSGKDAQSADAAPAPTPTPSPSPGQGTANSGDPASAPSTP